MTPTTTTNDHARYAEWDAAYVLGSLSTLERREYEAHLENCDRCRAAIADLAALPSLLGRLTPSQGFALLDDERTQPGPAPDLLARVTSLDRARRGRRNRLFAGLAAAALVIGATAVAVPLVVQSTQAPAIALELAATTEVPITADVQLHPVGWGTRIDMSCTYGKPGDTGGGGPWGYGLWVVDRGGHATQLSTWMAGDGDTAKISAGTALNERDIATVQIRTAAGDTVVAAAKVG